MKRLFIIAFLAALMGTFPTLAQQAYTEPNGRFSVTVPAGWTEDGTGFVHGNGSILRFLSAEADDVEAAMLIALATFAPESVDLEPLQTTRFSAANGDWTQDLYAPDEEIILAVIAQVNDGIAYIMYVEGTRNALYNVTIELQRAIPTIESQTIEARELEAAKLTDDMLAELTAYVPDAMQHHGVTGAAVAVVQDGEVIYAEGFGTLGIDDNTPVNSKTLFMIGSTTKTMTSTLAASLVDEGLLDWDAPVTDYLPEFALSDPTLTPQIRVRDLLNMQSGLPRFDYPMVLESLSPQEVIAWIGEVPIVAAPGEQFNYSNLMVAAGGYVTALAAGSEYDDNLQDAYEALVHERIFDPVGMNSATFDLDEAIDNPNHATPTTFDSEDQAFISVDINQERFVSSVSPAGAVWANVEDMGLYMATLMNGGVTADGTRIISEENLAEVQTPGLETGIGGYGIGWVVGNYRGLTVVGHGGATTGFTSLFDYLPEANLGVVVLSNRTISDNFNLSVRDTLFEIAFDLPHQADTLYQNAEEQLFQAFTTLLSQQESEPIDEETAAPFIGEYEHSLTIELDGDELIARTEMIEFPLVWQGEGGEFIGDDDGIGYALTFAENDDGVMTVTIESWLNVALGEEVPLLTLAKLE